MILEKHMKRPRNRNYGKISVNPLKKRRSKLLSGIMEFIKNNIKEYLVIIIIFIIGVFLGVLFINNSEESQISEIKSYLLMVYLNSVYVYHPILTRILIPNISGFRVWGMDPALLNRLYPNIKIPLR